MHPLQDDVNLASIEELERRYTEISRRLQKLRSWGQQSSDMYNQLMMMLDNINTERQERFLSMDRKSEDEPSHHIVLNTDPLPDDEDQEIKQKPKQKQFTLL